MQCFYHLPKVWPSVSFTQTCAQTVQNGLCLHECDECTSLGVTTGNANLRAPLHS